MRNIILLIRRSSFFLLFLILQILSIMLLVKYNRSHRARYMETAYELTGRINKRYNNFTRYFSLNENNRYLAAENNKLHNLVTDNFTFIDSTARLIGDTSMVDSTRMIRKYLWRHARVINNSTNSQNNYLTLERGRMQGINVDMAVMGPAGIVGKVTDVSDNMCIVMSLLHRKSATSVMMKKNGVSGILSWDGLNPGLLQLKNIPKSAEVKTGDTVLTSNLSSSFPPGLMVGTVEKVELEKAGGKYYLQIKPGTNFFNLEYVEVIQNLLQNEQRDLEIRAKKRGE